MDIQNFSKVPDAAKRPVSPYSIADMKQACVDVAKASGARSGYLRPQVQFGLSKLSLGATDVVDAKAQRRRSTTGLTRRRAAGSKRSWTIRSRATSSRS